MDTRQITFVISSLKGGGAERVMSLMANFWAEKGHNITIVTLAGSKDEVFYPLLPTVKLISLDVLGKAKNFLIDNINRIKKLRHVFETQKPDIIISFMETTNILTILAASGLKTPVIISDRIDPSRHSYGHHWRLLRNITYPFAKALILQTKDTTLNYPSFLTRRAIIISNPVQKTALSFKEKKNQSKKLTICAMGRLTQQKGFDILLRAFSKVLEKNPEIILQIWGEGEDRKNLETLCKDLNIERNVSFPGFSHDAYETLQKSDIFVLSSHYEGFPNVLLEAMACGLPVISTDCPCGPSEMITNGEDGILVPVNDIKALNKALDELIHNEPERNRLAQNAQKAIKRFSIEAIMEQWEAIIQTTLNSKSS